MSTEKLIPQNNNLFVRPDSQNTSVVDNGIYQVIDKAELSSIEGTIVHVSKTKKSKYKTGQKIIYSLSKEERVRFKDLDVIKEENVVATKSSNS